MVHQTSLSDAWSLKPGSTYSRAAFASHTATDVADAAPCRGLLLSCIPSTLWGTTTMASQEGLEPPTLGFETDALPVALLTHCFAEEVGIEPPQCRDQNPMPYRLATPLQSKCTRWPFDCWWVQ